MPNLTSNFEFNLPLVNDATDEDLWGGYLNSNWTDNDALFPQTTAAKSSSFNVAASEFNYFYLINSSGGAVTATLPAAADVFNGFVVRFKATDLTNTITIAGNGSETIDGAATTTIPSLEQTIELVCDGTNWRMKTRMDVASQADAEAGTATTGIMTPLRVNQAQKAFGFAGKLLHLQHQQTSGTSGGTFTSGAWQTRTLNTEITDEIGSTLATNQFTLPAGDYYIEADAPSFAVGLNKAKLYNITDASDVILGSSASAQASSSAASISRISGRFTIAGTKTFEIQHQCQTTKSTNGFGVASSFSVIEVFTDVRIWKVG